MHEGEIGQVVLYFFHSANLKNEKNAAENLILKLKRGKIIIMGFCSLKVYEGKPDKT